MNKVIEARGGLGVQQAVGYGKNWHTEFPEPITWENLTSLDHFVTALPNGEFLAGISDPTTDFATPVYQFKSEDDAMMWIRTALEKFKVHQFNQEL
tara:strand:+ start:313 stop:600 length:288 start_codon:yes stop_codon:yes gene_type:complete